jgi:hypothetical protein
MDIKEVITLTYSLKVPPSAKAIVSQSSTTEYKKITEKAERPVNLGR